MAARQTPLPADTRLKIARAEAIDAYGGMERSLAYLLSRLLGTSAELAGIILFRIANARTRNKMIEQLIKHKHGSKFNLYWNSVSKFIGQLDQKRNEVVHWQTMLSPHFGKSGRLTSVSAALELPNLWDRRRGKPKLTEKDINDFTLKCEFADAAIWYFAVYGTGTKSVNRKLRTIWRDIFQRALTYPPRETHPIRQRWPKPLIVLAPLRSRRT